MNKIISFLLIVFALVIYSCNSSEQKNQKNDKIEYSKKNKKECQKICNKAKKECVIDSEKVKTACNEKCSKNLDCNKSCTSVSKKQINVQKIVQKNAVKLSLILY